MRQYRAPEKIAIKDIIIISETYLTDSDTSTVESVGFVVKVIGNKIAINSACVGAEFNEHDPINRWIDLEKLAQDSSKKIVIIKQYQLAAQSALLEKAKEALEQSLERMNSSIEWHKEFGRLPAMDGAIAFVESTLKAIREAGV